LKKRFNDELIDDGDFLTYLIYTNQLVGYNVSVKFVGNLLVVESPNGEDSVPFHNEVKIKNLENYNLDRAQAAVDLNLISVCIPKKKDTAEVQPVYYT
jgi:hypothetical protein